MLHEEDHGLGIGTVERSKVIELTLAIAVAARRANALGVSEERFLGACEAALDVDALLETTPIN
jgi:hypothetical protein